eukprot:gnl/MRDRNA2_/MRDRNA2_18271_c0_seq1.p1 gnl/MRDRNA2_/MRDRNA2_18271_c0~~gnl/MRDRNA2_/MRDRNA2_18271_c0_seq1.p1  ORF type:complete len:654 (-),score=117.08 gnl/MRDRNA2_/MRDRNA2_18271_c0_seq1:191-1876(-)
MEEPPEEDTEWEPSESDESDETEWDSDMKTDDDRHLLKKGKGTEGEREGEAEDEHHDHTNGTRWCRVRKNVRLKGLLRSSVNGKVGTIAEIRSDGRLVVSVEGHGLLAVRRANAEPIRSSIVTDRDHEVMTEDTENENETEDASMLPDDTEQNQSESFPFICDSPGCKSAFTTKRGLLRHNRTLHNSQNVSATETGRGRRGKRNARSSDRKAVEPGEEGWKWLWQEWLRRARIRKIKWLPNKNQENATSEGMLSKVVEVYKWFSDRKRRWSHDIFGGAHWEFDRHKRNKHNHSKQNHSVGGFQRQYKYYKFACDFPGCKKVFVYSGDFQRHIRLKHNRSFAEAAKARPKTGNRGKARSVSQPEFQTVNKSHLEQQLQQLRSFQLRQIQLQQQWQQKQLQLQQQWQQHHLQQQIQQLQQLRQPQNHFLQQPFRQAVPPLYLYPTKQPGHLVHFPTPIPWNATLFVQRPTPLPSFTSLVHYPSFPSNVSFTHFPTPAPWFTLPPHFPNSSYQAHFPTPPPFIASNLFPGLLPHFRPAIQFTTPPPHFLGHYVGGLYNHAAMAS